MGGCVWDDRDNLCVFLDLHLASLDLGECGFFEADLPLPTLDLGEVVG